MTSSELFIEFLHRLQRYDDAAVLHAVLQEHADIKEFKTSATMISLNLLGGLVTKLQVQRSIERLKAVGLLATRAYPNYRTCISVDGDALRAFLVAPVSNNIPGLRTDSFPFLDALNKAAQGKARAATNAVIKRMGQDTGKAADDDFPDKPDA